MMVQAFFAWIENANASERAQAAVTLARAYLAGAYGSDRPEEIEAALMAVLDDPSPLVRRALAMVMADRKDAPRALVLSLARDQAEVSGLLMARSPLLTEADLIDLAGSAERLALVAIALRADVNARIASAVIARDDVDALFALLRNTQAQIAAGSLLEVAGRYGNCAQLREALLARAALPAEARHLLMRAVSDALGAFVGAGGFLAPARQKRAISEAIETGTLEIAQQAGAELPDFIDHLRERAELTPALLLRSVLSGDTRFVSGALAEICTLPPSRVDSMIAGGSEAALGALLRKAGLPDFLVCVMISALVTAIRLPANERGHGLHLGVIRAAQSAIIGGTGDESLRLLALLRRYEAEAARAAARALAKTLRSRLTSSVVRVLSAPEQGVDMLRLAGFEGDARIALDVEAEPEQAMPRVQEELATEEDVAALVADEKVPDLANLIAQWKAERATLEAGLTAEAVNENGGADDTEKAA